MPDAVATIADFLSAIRRHGLVDEAGLETACAAWPDRSLPLPDGLVRKLIDDDLLTDWQAGLLKDGKKHVFFLGKYKLLRRLGQGGMGTVYLAWHPGLKKKRAIKVLPPASVAKGSYLRRFEREYGAASELRHDNIVGYTDLDTTGPIKYMAMEYVDGVDLHAKVKQEGPLPIHEAARYIMQAARGLQYAHDRGVIHRDIKPANLIVTADGMVKILDFGLALADDEEQDASLTQTFDEKVLGTADYLAPEQAIDSHKADARADIYALGCTLYYLIVGKVLFPEGGVKERLVAHQREGGRPNPLDARSDVPRAVVELYFRMVERYPDLRPQTAKEVADALAPWAEPSQAAAGPAASRPPGSGIGRRSAGSGTGLRPPGSGVGLRPMGSVATAAPVVITPPTATGGRRPAPNPPGGPGRKAAAKPGAASAGEETAEPTKRAGPWTFAGLPLGFWIVAAAGVVLAISLAIGLWLKASPPTRAKATKNATTSGGRRQSEASKDDAKSETTEAGQQDAIDAALRANQPRKP